MESNERTESLHQFLKQGEDKLVWKLLNEGLDVNLKDTCGKIALHRAFWKYNTNIVKAILERTLDVNVKDYDGRSPLHYAATHGPPEGVKLLLKNGAMADIVDGHGETPLHLALIENNMKSANILVENGASLNVQDDWNYTALHLIVVHAAKTDDYKKYTMNLLLDKEVDVNAQNINGETPLHSLLKYCSTSEIYELCSLLLKKGTNLFLQDTSGQTPLHVAIKPSAPYITPKKCVELVKLLINSGAELDCKNNSEYISQACRGSEIASLSPETLEAALVNAKTFGGMTPLHYAVKVGVDEIVELLLSRGADVNSKNNKGQTPLFYVSNKNILSALLQKGAEVNVKDMKGRTFLHYVGERKTWNNKIIDMLLDWGALLSIKDNSGKIPVDLCNKCRTQGFTNAYLKYLIRRVCVNQPQKLTEEVRSDVSISYLESCRMEVDEMKGTKFGNNFLYDIFRQRDDPKFLWNKKVEKVAKSKKLKVLIPIYSSLLKATYIKAKKRMELLAAAADILNLPLPREVTWHILTFLDDDSLLNVKNI